MIICTFEKGYTDKLRHVVVQAIVEDKGKLLLLKRVDDLLEIGKWSLPGGFLDHGETAAEGVLRELKEEAGWQGKVISLFRINTSPRRPHEDRQNVSLEFIIKPLRQIGLPHDGSASQVAWIPLDKLSSLSRLAFDNAETINLYLKHRRKKFSLPLVI